MGEGGGVGERGGGGRGGGGGGGGGGSGSSGGGGSGGGGSSSGSGGGACGGGGGGGGEGGGGKGGGGEGGGGEGAAGLTRGLALAERGGAGETAFEAYLSPAKFDVGLTRALPTASDAAASLPGLTQQVNPSLPLGERGEVGEVVSEGRCPVGARFDVVGLVSGERGEAGEVVSEGRCPSKVVSEGRCHEGRRPSIVSFELTIAGHSHEGYRSPERFSDAGLAPGEVGDAASEGYLSPLGLRVNSNSNPYAGEASDSNPNFNAGEASEAACSPEGTEWVGSLDASSTPARRIIAASERSPTADQTRRRL